MGKGAATSALDVCKIFALFLYMFPTGKTKKTFKFGHVWFGVSYVGSKLQKRDQLLVMQLLIKKIYIVLITWHSLPYA